MNRPLKIKLWILLGICCGMAILGLSVGSVPLTWPQLLSSEYRLIFLIRLWRVILAAVAGGGLAVAGIILQAILRNPLAEPYLLGTSSGAGLGAVTAAILGFSSAFFPLSAFLGALAATLCVLQLSRIGGRVPVQSLILNGVIISIALSGIIVFLISTSANEALHGLMWWLWGSLQAFDPRLLAVVTIIVAVGIACAYVFAQDLNAVCLGEENAVHLGVNIETVKIVLLFITAVMAASLVSICGIIGFVGLIVPHAARFWIGPNHKVLIPVTCLAAAAFMIGCDLISRSIVAPMEVPIGIVTAIIGAPIFLVLFKKKQTTGAGS
ncbi:MAG: iron ABC transporter permease [Candidatus Omnitrophica bacterium]|nr:iron ABC transporter permease [Candidatus Omnitrophota bacterium]MDD5574016.1 iron ABC transporter permease [Candidatus Omnitrophota bacterium]